VRFVEAFVECGDMEPTVDPVDAIIGEEEEKGDAEHEVRPAIL